ncbi:MAG: FkbM family methyltransferase [Verrucomicrobiota bacterium]
MKSLARTFQKIARRFGCDLVPLPDPQAVGHDPFRDMSRFLGDITNPMIFDVGANVGQSVAKFKKTFPACSIHAFEPGSSTFHQLRERAGGFSDVRPWNLGVGSQAGRLVLQENEHSTMSSFLEPSKFCWGGVVNRNEVEIATLDAFAAQQGIETVHILKSDTQGFDLEVFKGASGLMDANRIALVYFEFIFSDMYRGLPSFDEVFGFLNRKNFQLVCFYEQNFQRELLSWADALFINRDFNARRTPALVDKSLLRESCFQTGDQAAP